MTLWRRFRCWLKPGPDCPIPAEKQNEINEQQRFMARLRAMEMDLDVLRVRQEQREREQS